MVLLQNAEPRILNKKNFDQKLSLWKAKFKILDGQEQKTMNINNPNICKTKFSVT